MRHPLQSEPLKIGPTGPLPDSANKATLELLSIWQQEDATTDPAQLRAAEEELAVFMKTVNEARKASGEPLIYP